MDDGYCVAIIKVDGGIMHNEKDDENAYDFVIIASNSNDKMGCVTEIKATEKGEKVLHAYEQISLSIKRNNREYIYNSDYVMAAIVGTQGKTLPSMINPKKKELYRLLQSRFKQKVRNIDKLVFYVQVSNKNKKVFVNKSKSPYVIECNLKTGGEILVPSTLKEAVE